LTLTCGSVTVPVPAGTMKLTVPPLSIGRTCPGRMAVTFEVQVIVFDGGFVQVTVSEPEPGVILVGVTLKDAGL